MYPHNSLLNNKWKIKNFNERESLMISQRHNLLPVLGKLLSLRNISEDKVKNYLHPNFNDSIPNPFDLKDMNKSLDRTIINIINKKILE